MEESWACGLHGVCSEPEEKKEENIWVGIIDHLYDSPSRTPVPLAYPVYLRGEIIRNEIKFVDDLLRYG